MTALAYKPKLRGDVEFVGLLADQPTTRLRLVKFETWVPETYAPVAALMRNGRPRNIATTPGFRAGLPSRNRGKKFPPEPLTPQEALALLAVIDPQTMAGVRNRALIALLWRTGLRISEALDLRPHHVDFVAHRVTVLHGKGDKRRTIGIDGGGLVAVQPWLLERNILLQAVPMRKATAPLFCTIQLPGRGGRMHSAYVRSVIHKYGALAGIQKRVHPHGFRHTLACDLIHEGFGITDAQAQLGHANPATTAVYLRGMGADEAFEKVAERVWPAGVR